MTSMNEIEQKLAVLRQQFATRLLDTQSQIKDWECDTPEVYLDDFISAVHKLAGTAGTYGYQQLSVDMKAIEQEAISLSADKKRRNELNVLYQQAAKKIQQALI